MDNVQKHYNFSNIPSSQTFKSYLIIKITVKWMKEDGTTHDITVQFQGSLHLSSACTTPRHCYVANYTRVYIPTI
jgi:hypothetical protein